MKFSVTVSTWILLNAVIDPADADPSGTCEECNGPKNACPGDLWAYSNSLIPDGTFSRHVSSQTVTVKVNSQAYGSFCPALSSFLENPTSYGAIDGACSGAGHNILDINTWVGGAIPNQLGELLPNYDGLTALFGDKFNVAMTLFEENSGQLMSILQNYASGLMGPQLNDIFPANSGNEADSNLFDGADAANLTAASLLEGLTRRSLISDGARNLAGLDLKQLNSIILPDFLKGKKFLVPYYYSCKFSINTNAGSLSIQGQLPSAESCVLSLLKSGGIGALLDYGSSFPSSLDGICCSILDASGTSFGYNGAQGDVRVCQAPSVLQELIISLARYIYDYVELFYPTLLLLWSLGHIADAIIIKITAFVFVLAVAFLYFIITLDFDDILEEDLFSGVKSQMEQLASDFGLSAVYSAATDLVSQEAALAIQGLLQSSLDKFASSKEGASFVEGRAAASVNVGKESTHREKIGDSLKDILDLFYTGIFGLYFDFSELDGCQKDQCCTRYF